MPVHIGRPKVPPLMSVSKPFMVDSHKMQDGGLNVMDTNRILHNMKTQIIGLAQLHTRLDPTARKPHGEGLRMMILP